MDVKKSIKRCPKNFTTQPKLSNATGCGNGDMRFEHGHCYVQEWLNSFGDTIETLDVCTQCGIEERRVLSHRKDVPDRVTHTARRPPR